MMILNQIMLNKVISNKIASRLCQRYIAKSKVVGFLVGLSVTGGILTLSDPARAVETVKLVFESDSVVVSLDEIRSFARTGQPPTQIEQFLLDQGQPAEVIARLLTEEITLSENLRARLRGKLEESSIGEFVLYQIDKIIQGSGDLTALKVALDRSMEDRTISVLELLENYTDADQVTVNLVGLRQTYVDVKAFVERVIPVLEAAKGYLQDIICDCETPQQTNSSGSSSSGSSQSQLPHNQIAPVVNTTTQTATSPMTVPMTAPANIPCLESVTTPAVPFVLESNSPDLPAITPDSTARASAIQSSQR